MAPNIGNPTHDEVLAPPPSLSGSNLRKREKEKIFPKEEVPFTVGDLKRAIPARCFQPTLKESFSHLFKDLLEITISAGAMYLLDGYLYNLSPIVWVLSWLAYAWFQGVVMTGVWVIAHECGHGAFSTSDTINDAVGFVLHTALSVPYFSWQHSHANHHHFTNNLQKDEVFVPRKKSEVELTSAYKTLPNHPIVVFVQLVFMLLLGWPLYLLMNTSGHATPGFASHFLPNSSIFTRKERVKVIVSDLGLLAWWGLLYFIGQSIGGYLILRLYLLPLLVTNAFLVAITYMQHTHVDVPHFDDEDWTWLRGALSTVDRTMGPWLDRKLHLIHVTHVVHHVFHRIPFYRSEEAHAAMVKVLGKYYNRDDSNYLWAMWRNCNDCVFLEEGKGILFWLTESH